MKRQGVLIVLLTAAATTAFTVMLFAPGRLGAGDAPKIKAMIPQPRFESQGCVFTLKTDKAEYEAGDIPVVDVKASNPTDTAQEATVWINILASGPESPMSRTISIPRVIWSHPHVVWLQPGEDKTLSLASDAKLPAGQRVLFTMTDKQQTILAAGAGVKRAKGTGQAPAAAKTTAAKS
jgi:hypothetical protein